MKLIHYGSNEWNPAKFKPIQNADWPSCKPKPGTGLWASPVDSLHGWRDWCETEGFNVERLDECFTFRINVARLFVIDSYRDIEFSLPLHPKSTSHLIGFDFEKMAERYDAIHLTVGGLSATRFSMPRNLYTWDCESVLIMNPEIVKPCTLPTA